MARRPNLQVLSLEERCTPALTIQFDYSLDTRGFFSDPLKRDLLEQAGRDFSSRIADQPLAITPSSGNSWTALFFDPVTGQPTHINNLNVPAGTVIVFAGSRQLDGNEAGVGGNGGYNVNGSSAWIQTVSSRGQPGISIWGGSIAFNDGLDWYYEPTGDNLHPEVNDLYTVAIHELGHLFGIGVAYQYENLVAGHNFTGRYATALNNGVAPRLSSDKDHLALGTTWNGQPVSMQPMIIPGMRYGFTEMDYALLADIGWRIQPEPVVLPSTPNPNRVPGTPFSISGAPNGLVAHVQYDGESLLPAGEPIKPFPDFNGVVRSSVADVNDDGINDMIYATGPGSPSRLRVVSGATGEDLMPPMAIFGEEFEGGLFVATADFDRDGNSEIIVSPDAGGGARVVVFNFFARDIYNDVIPGITRIADFFGIDDADFRGGARVAAADIDGDYYADLVVAAGTGGGPRIALFDGTDIGSPTPRKLIGDFFAFGPDSNTLRNGVYIACGDLNGDNRAEIIVGAGPGGGPRVTVYDATFVLTEYDELLYYSPIANFFAFDPDDRGGVQVSVKDVDGDGLLDLITGSGSSKALSIYSGLTAVWEGGDPGNGMTFKPSSVESAEEGVFVG